MLIQHALRTAGAAAASQTQPWVELALKAGLEAEPDRQAIDFLIERLYAEDAEREEKMNKLGKRTCATKSQSSNGLPKRLKKLLYS